MTMTVWEKSMFGPVHSVLGLIFWLLAIAAFVMCAWALIHALRIPTRAFPAAGKQTKPLWLIILGFATLFTFSGAVGYFGGGMPNLLTIIAVIAAGIYLADVKPAVSQYRSGGSQGPYGPW